MHVARTCDDRVDDMKAQHAAALIAEEAYVAKLSEEKSDLKAANSSLEAQLAVLQAQATSKLTDIDTAVAALHTLLPPPLPLVSVASVAFDRKWCTAACGKKWKVDIDADTGLRAHVTESGHGGSSLTLRSVTPLPRRTSLPRVVDERRQDQLFAYRVVLEAHGQSKRCCLGFVSHSVATMAADLSLDHDYGWYIELLASQRGYRIGSGWTVLNPSRGAGDVAADTSAYATTAQVPPVPAGSAVEFAVDYAAGTCRVAFYTPAAVAGGFVEAPHAQMELRFVGPDPTLADSGLALYPAAEAFDAGTIWRFAS
jgi:hypothetical protein